MVVDRERAFTRRHLRDVVAEFLGADETPDLPHRRAFIFDLHFFRHREGEWLTFDVTDIFDVL